MWTSILPFLQELSENNTKEWFQNNKERYEKECKQPFESLVEDVSACLLAKGIAAELGSRSGIFRIHRDTRFSKNKLPYKNHVAAVFGSSNIPRALRPGGYLHIQPGESFIGGGIYAPEPDLARSIRAAIVSDAEVALAAFEHPAFVARYGEVRGESYKTVPADLRTVANPPDVAKKKAWYWMAPLPESVLAQGDAAEHIAAIIADAREPIAFLEDVLLRAL